MAVKSKIVDSGYYPVYIGGNLHQIMENFLHLPRFKKSTFFIVVDENTEKCCLKDIQRHVPDLHEAAIIKTRSGEEYKNIDSAARIWQYLLDHHADRHSVLINLGGGVLSDLAGFVAATYKRGIRFINVPTTLMGQIDASLGGKVGIDYNNLKNQIGLYTNPQAVFIKPEYLETLPEEHMISAFAEMGKHGLVADAFYWRMLSGLKISDIDDWFKHIARSVEIKTSIVRTDPLERKYRKILNFGHTTGHALETLKLEKGTAISHGIAVGMGMVCEAYISHKQLFLPESMLKDVSAFSLNNFGKVELKDDDIDIIIEKMKDDKKNEEDQILFTLISAPGHAKINQACDEGLIRESMVYYQNLTGK